MFFNPILIELKKLELGVKIKLSDIEKERKFFLIAGIFDKPARYSLLNMTSYNGFFGCTKCLQPGISYRANESCKFNYNNN